MSAASVSVAGCSGSTDSGSSDGESADSDGKSEHSIPDYVVDEDAQQLPTIVDISIRSDDLTPGARLPINLAVANLGGADITGMELTTEFRHTEDGYASGSATTELTDVPSGEWTSKRVELAVETVGEWTLTVPDAEMHPEVEPTVSISPAKIGVGDSTAILDRVSIELLESRVQPAVFLTEPDDYYDEPTTRLFFSGNDAVWAINRFEVTVDRDEAITIGKVHDEPRSDPHVRNFPYEPESGGLLQDPIKTKDFPTIQIQGEPLIAGSVLEPGTTEMWSIAEIRRDETENVEVGLSLYGQDRQDRYELDKPDVIFDTIETPLKLPKFELVDYSYSESDLSLELTVQNTGDVAGTFRGAAEWEKGSQTYIGHPEPIVKEIPAGETVTEQIELTEDSEGGRTYIRPFSADFYF